MAAKLPVIVSDIQGPMEVIGYGKYGMSFKSGDANDLAEKLKTVLQGGYDYSLIEKAYQHVCEEYDVSTTAKRYLEEYRRVIR
jgi:glycosyltransferase involved in cell wall biosynthesis